MLPNCHLPEGVIVDILSRLPVKSVVRFSSVSKPWYSLLTSPSFIKMHLLRRNNSYELLAVNGHSKWGASDLSVYRRDDGACFSVPLSPFAFNSHVIANIVGSCNGLVCVHGIIDERPAVVLWNPSTTQFRYLLLYHCDDQLFNSTFVGLGFLPEADDYKIVVFRFHMHGWYNSVNPTKCLVYTLSLDSWKSIEVNVPDADFSKTAIAMNGIFHWVACGSNNPLFIASFDSRGEAFGQMNLPDSSGFGNHIERELVVLKGSLSVILYPMSQLVDRSFEIWVMIEYGVPESWTKLFTVEPFPSMVEPVGSWKNDEVIFHCLSSDELFLYDPSIQKAEYFQVPDAGTKDLIIAFNYVESLESVGGKTRIIRR